MRRSPTWFHPSKLSVCRNPFVVLCLRHPAVRCCNSKRIQFCPVRRRRALISSSAAAVRAHQPTMSNQCSWASSDVGLSMMVNALNLTAKSKGGLDRYPGYCPGRHFLFLLKYNASCESSRGHLPTGNPAAIYAASKALHQKSTPASALLSALTPAFISS
jgi:hypothetical protein